jgi:hypothetical protein
MRLYGKLLIVLLLVTAGCSGRSVVGLPGSMDQLVRQALEARLDGLGGCRELSGPPQRIALDAFPNVSFWLGRCTLEHGQPGAAVVASDADGVLYIPGSESAFRFLVKRHPPTAASLDDSLQYASLALRLMARVDWSAAFVSDANGLPSAVRNTIEGADKSVVSSTEWGMPIVITMASDYSVDRFSIGINAAGSISVGEHAQLWSSLE